MRRSSETDWDSSPSEYVMYQLIVIGAGPAGMTAAVYAARKKLNALVTGHDLGGQPLYNTLVIENENGC